MGTHPFAPWGVPPVLDITFRKLARGVDDDLLAQTCRVSQRQRHCILQLVPKAKSATSLVKAGLGPETANNSLVKQPMVDQRVKFGVGRSHLHFAQQR